MTRAGVLRALCRFDTATTEEIATACGGTRIQAAHHLRALVAAGHVSTLGENYIRYSATDTGRSAAKGRTA